jgi:hypothetical protein
MTTQSGRSGGVGTGRITLNPVNCPRVSTKQVEKEAEIAYCEIKREGKGMWWGKPIITKNHYIVLSQPEWFTIGETNYLAWLTLYTRRMDIYASVINTMRIYKLSICESLELITHENPEIVFSHDTPKYYPELYVRKPEDKPMDKYWWDHHNITPRIETINSILEEMQGNINNGIIPKYDKL